MTKVLEKVEGWILNPLLPGAPRAGRIHIEDGRITHVQWINSPLNPDLFITPPFVNSHIHTESSLLSPAHLATAALCNGVHAVVADPHEAANVMGVQAIDWMVENGRNSPMQFAWMAPSCVPSSPFNQGGEALSVEQVIDLLKRPEFHGLGEVMNCIGLIQGDDDLRRMIEAAQRLGKAVDAHAPPFLEGQQLSMYSALGPTADHESSSYQNALAKIAVGMMIAIRQGSAARDFDALYPLVKEHRNKTMFCSDDCHPYDLLTNGIFQSVINAASLNGDWRTALLAAAHTPINHYKLDLGCLNVGEWADMNVVYKFFNSAEAQVMKTIRRGKLVVQNGIPLFGVDQPSVINNFRANQLTVEDIALRCSEQYGNVISVLDGKLETERIVRPLACNDFHLVGDRMNDVLKIVCLDRYGRQRLGIGLVHGFGLQRGAMASSVSHDAHNIVAVGTNDDDIIAAVNQVVAAKGGISVANGNMQHCLELPILGLMSNKGHVEVAERYMDLLGIAKDRDSLASPLRDPFMTLSFMCLEVIGDLKLTPFGMVTLGKTGFEQVPTLQQCA